MQNTGAILNVLTRVAQDINTEKRHLIINAFFHHNLIIVHLLGCSTIGRSIIK